MKIQSLHPFDRTFRVAMELSNRCPLARSHRKCPAHLESKKAQGTLPKAIVEEVLCTLRAHNFGVGQSISWHQYNEPTIDPRLFWFIEKTRALLPDVAIVLWTNGYHSDETIVQELLDVGVTHMVLTSYHGPAEKARFEGLKKLCGRNQCIKVSSARLDGRLGRSAATATDTPLRNRRCFAPLGDLNIRQDGNLSLCCYDWQQSVTFGNLRNKPFLEIMHERYDEMLALQTDLLVGIRRLPVCRACVNARHRSSLRFNRPLGASRRLIRNQPQARRVASAEEPTEDRRA